MARSRRPQVVFPEVIRTATVTDTRQLGPGMRRIVLRGEELRAFERGGFRFPAFRSEGFDDFVRLFFPVDDAGTVLLPIQHERTVEWPQDPRPVSRNYTVRRFDEHTAELVLDFASHDTGVASTWGKRCVTGDSISFVGPVRSGLPPTGVDWVLLVGDETALPAMARYLEEASPESNIRVFVEVADAGRRLPMPTNARAEVTWVYRDDSESSSPLEAAVRAAPWPQGSVFAWVAGESTSLRGIRRYLREDRALPPDMVDITGYWRRVDVPALVDDPEPFDKLSERAEIFSPFAIRAANTLRIPWHVSRGVSGTAELAAATGTDPRALAKFVRYLVAVEVLAFDATGKLVPGDVGDAMLGDDWISNWLDLDGIEARVELSVTGLVESLRGGAASSSAVTGRTLSADLDGDPRLAGLHHDHIADEAAFLGPALIEDYSFDGVSTLLVTGPGSGVVLGSILSTYPQIEAGVLGLPSELARVRRDLANWPSAGGRVRDAAQSPTAEPAWIPHGGFDVYLLVEVTGHYPDDDLVLLLTNAAVGIGDRGKLVVVERLLDDAAVGEDQAEFDLLLLCMYGSGVRTRAEFDALARRAGLVVTAHQLFGWGISALDLRRAGPVADEVLEGR